MLKVPSQMMAKGSSNVLLLFVLQQRENCNREKSGQKSTPTASQNSIVAKKRNKNKK